MNDEKYECLVTVFRTDLGDKIQACAVIQYCTKTLYPRVEASILISISGAIYNRTVSFNVAVNSRPSLLL